MNIVANIKVNLKLGNAARAFAKKKYEKAEEIYLSAFALEPDNFEVNLWLGTLYSEMKKEDNGTKYLQKAIEIKPDDDRAYFNLAMDAITKKEFQIAIEYFEAALKKCKIKKVRKAEFYYGIARQHISLGDFQKGHTFATKAFALRPDFKLAKEAIDFTEKRIKS